MRKAHLLGLMVLSLFAFAAFTATSAFAEDPNAPSILLLEGKSSKKGSELTGKFTAGVSSLSTLSGKTIEGKTAEAALNGCESISGHEFDVSLCKDVVVTFTGTKKEKVACRSENAKGEKDAIETILTLLDLHIASEESLEEGKEMVLQPLLLAKVLGTALEAELLINCGGVKEAVKGAIGCLLLPGLVNIPITENAKITCAYNTSHDPVTGHCEQLCEWLEKEPLLGSLGAGFEDAWETISLTGTFNEHIYIDD